MKIMLLFVVNWLFESLQNLELQHFILYTSPALSNVPLSHSDFEKHPLLTVFPPLADVIPRD